MGMKQTQWSKLRCDLEVKKEFHSGCFAHAQNQWILLYFQSSCCCLKNQGRFGNHPMSAHVLWTEWRFKLPHWKIGAGDLEMINGKNEAARVWITGTNHFNVLFVLKLLYFAADPDPLEGFLRALSVVANQPMPASKSLHRLPQSMTDEYGGDVTVPHIQV